jgi:hypothetical protein
MKINTRRIMTNNEAKKDIWNTVQEGHEILCPADHAEELIKAHEKIYGEEKNIETVEKSCDEEEKSISVDKDKRKRSNTPWQWEYEAYKTRGDLFGWVKEKSQKDKSKNDSLLVSYTSDLDTLIEEAVKLAMTGKEVCIASRDYEAQNKLADRITEFCDYKNTHPIVHLCCQKVDMIYFKYGTIHLCNFNHKNFIGRDYHKAFIYMHNSNMTNTEFNELKHALMMRCRL